MARRVLWLTFAYRLVPVVRAPAARASLRGHPRCARRPSELDRMIASSPENGAASHLRVFSRPDGAAISSAATRSAPSRCPVLGTLALEEGRSRDALRELELERRRHEPMPGSYYRSALAFQQLGQSGRAWAAYRRELALHPDHAASRDSIAALQARRRR
jgi:hypothetical protein